MSPVPGSSKQRRRAPVDAALIFVVVLLMVQMWLLTATLESYLAGHRDVALFGMLLSGVLFAGALAMYLFVARLDRRPDLEDKPNRFGPWDIR
jgi:predicted Co/Zn/Cd cation transporter (cation efflux family)